MGEVPKPLAALLRWHLLVGVDETIGDGPVDRYARTAPAATPTPTAPAPLPRPAEHDPRPSPQPPATAMETGEAAVRSAVVQAAEAQTIDDLRHALERFDGCALARTATNLVFGDGNPQGRLVLIGEAPGAEEDRRGLPFVGPSGRLLDRMLDSIGLDRTQVFISNTVFWRPPGNRNPTTGETAACMPFVQRLIELIDPDCLVALGGPAAAALLGRRDGVGKLRGRWYDYQSPGLSRPVRATVTFHPAYLLRSPAQKRLAWRDFLGIKRALSEP